MAHEHSHGEPDNTYFLDQLCTIAVGGLLGFTAIGLYSKGWLQTKFGLIDRFHIPVLAAGVALIVMVALRALAVWKMAGQKRTLTAEPTAAGHKHSHAHDANCDHAHSEKCELGHDHAHGHEHSHAAKHEHSHGHDHAHGHEHSHAAHNEHSHATAHDHAHGDDAHDHGWAPWRYAILIIPAVLFFLELPADGYNMTRLNDDLQDVDLDSSAGPVAKKNRKVNLRFSQLSVLASREQSRKAYEGTTVTLEGHFKMIPKTDKEFQLFRVMNNCCGSDSITLKSRIVAPDALVGYQYMDWVSITGEISFQKVTGREEWMPVIHLQSMDDMKKKEMPSNPNKDV